MKERLLASGEARRILGVPHATLHSWIDRGIIQPAVPGKGLGTCLMVTIPQTLGIAVGRSLRKSGFSLGIAGAVTQAIMSLSQESLDAALAQGRRCRVELLAKSTIRGLWNSIPDANPRDRDALTKHAKRSMTASGVVNLLRLAAPEVAVTHEVLDTDPWSFNCPNGTLDLKTGKLREHCRDDLITKRCEVTYSRTRNLRRSYGPNCRRS